MILHAGGLPPAQTLMTIFVLSLSSGLDMLYIYITSIYEYICTWDLRHETWDLRHESWELRAETWDLHLDPRLDPPNIISQTVDKSHFRHSETFAPSKMTHLSPRNPISEVTMARRGQSDKFVAVGVPGPETNAYLIVFAFKVGQLYPRVPRTKQNPKLDWCLAECA